MICTSINCETPTELYLCAQCVRDMQAWIDKIPTLLPELDVTIRRQDVLRKAGNEGGNGTGGGGSAAPINLDAWQLKINLSSVTQPAAEYAKDQFAAGIATTIQDWVTKAERIISGPEPEHVDHAAVRERVENIAPPMPTRQLLPWLKEHAQLAITSQHIRNWVRRGHLHPAKLDPSPAYRPHDVLAAYHRKDTP